jgi:hypothetical protein
MIELTENHEGSGSVGARTAPAAGRRNRNNLIHAVHPVNGQEQLPAGSPAIYPILLAETGPMGWGGCSVSRR